VEFKTLAPVRSSSDGSPELEGPKRDVTEDALSAGTDTERGFKLEA